MMSASMQGAMAFQKGLGCVHSLSHSLGGVNPRLHHGTLNAMFLPAVIRFNAQAESVQRDKRMERMAYAMSLGDIQGAVNAAEAVAQAIVHMNARLGLPKGLADTKPIRGWPAMRTMWRCSKRRCKTLATMPFAQSICAIS
jgi:alcohol dehydrogenase class IV